MSAGVSVTALLAGRGLLWVGTNVGIALTIPLPRLEGVPIISGRVNISYHAHFGPITFLLALQPRPTRTSRVQAQADNGSVQEEQPVESQKVCKSTIYLNVRPLLCSGKYTKIVIGKFLLLFNNYL